MNEINIFLFLIILFVFIFIFILIKSKVLKFSISWVFFWLLIASLNYLHAPRIPILSISIFLIFLIFLSLSYIYSNTKFKNHNPLNYDINEQISHVKKYIYLFTIIIIPAQVILSVNTLSSLNELDIFNLRRELFASESSIISSEYLSIYILIIGGLSKFVLFSSLYVFFKSGKNIFLLIPLILTLNSSITTLGRYPIYEFIITFIIIALINNKFKAKHIMLIFLFFIFLIIFSIIRSGGYYSILDVFERHIIGYHTFGFYLFDYKLDTVSPLNDSWLGLATLSSFGYVITLPFTWLTGMKNYMQSPSYLDQDTFFLVGQFSNGNELYANALYTMLYEPYIDFGIIGIIIYAVFLGISLAILNKIKTNNIYAGILFSFFNVLLVVGIMKNPLLRHEVIIPLILLFFLAIKVNKQNRVKRNV